MTLYCICLIYSLKKMMKLNDAIPILNSFIRSLAPVSDEILSENAQYYSLEFFKKGEHIFRQGDKVTDLFFIIQGLVRLYYVLPDGVEKDKSFYAENGVITCYRSMLGSMASNLNVQCLEDIYVLRGDYAKVRALNDRDLQLQIVARKIAEREFIKKDIREFQFLALDAKGRLTAFLETHGNIIDRIPNRNIASYLGIRPETLSRIR